MRRETVLPIAARVHRQIWFNMAPSAVRSIADLLPWALKISYYFPAVADNQPGKIKTA